MQIRIHPLALIALFALALGSLSFGQYDGGGQTGPASGPTTGTVGSSIIQAGDEIGVEVAGFAKFGGSVLVLGDGTVTGIGFDQVHVAGLTLMQAKVELTKALAKTIKNPYVSVVMLKPIGQFVYVVGSTALPGPHPFFPGLTVRQLIGEVSLPDIPTRLDARLNRADGTSLDLDLEAILHDNDPLGLTKLDPNDVMVVLPKARVRIWVDGLVNKPGEVRVDAGTDVYQAIDAAGGVRGDSLAPNPGAFVMDEAKIIVQRGKQSFTFPIRQPAQPSSFKIEANDIVSVDTPKLVRIIMAGEVNAPGQHLVTQDSNVFQAIQSSQGNDPNSTLTNVTVFRGPDAFEVNADYHGKHLPTAFLVKEGDVIYVHRNLRRIYVLGKVNSPGEFVIKDGETVTASQALALAHGLNGGGSLRRVYLIHPDDNGKFTKREFNLDDFLKDGKASANPIIAPGDVLLFGGPSGISFGDIAQVVSTAYLLKVLF